MGAVRRLRDGFVSALAVGSVFAAPACAQDDQTAHATPVALTTTSATSTNVEIMPDADREAGRWVHGYPNRLAVAVRVGPETEVPLERIGNAFRSDFADQGYQNVPVFFERGEAGGSTVTFVTDEYVYGPFLLQDSRDQVAPTVSQIRFNGRRTAALN